MTRIKRTGWTKSRRSWTVGENIGYGSGSLATPREMVQRLDEQLRPPREHPRPAVQQIGIGVANGAPKGGSGAT